MSVDTAMYIQSERGERILISVRLDTLAQESVELEPELMPDDEIHGKMAMYFFILLLFL